ncbi:cell division protein ZapA [Salirhabdus euzebyi]|uniref:Cell division protein ZapA n=1 Tax=Salirhabdus euzebyi TaxID=394506 RepID=A0A841PXA1_9BACI|nr:cell division protein ZapA [Salirhabdus euzebyi]MBB6452046.1 cell division protein ZapA [Salirhabdus euzebyi]
MSHSDKTRTTVEIHNQKYTVVGEEPSHHIQMIASMVDQKMKEIQEANPRLDTAKLAVLTAVNAMNDYIKLKEEYRSMTEQLRSEERRKNG